MMLKITERCTMGCPHCMNNAKPDGKDMTLETLDKSLDFLKANNVGKVLILTGGEPTEHRLFDDMIMHLLSWEKRNDYFSVITITTNGENIQKDPITYEDYITMFSLLGVTLLFQISADVRYYPRRIETHKRIFRQKGFTLVDDCVEQVYPQGRALDNKLDWKAKASKCFNVRAISKQIPNCRLEDIEVQLAVREKFCTPHIAIDGSIKLGESDLCPSCAHIDDDPKDIMRKIKEFKCHQCDFINDALDDKYKQFL